MNTKILPPSDFNAKPLLIFLEQQAQTKETLRILRHQGVCVNKIQNLLCKLQEQNAPEWLIYCHLFNYGYIEGKRAERRKSKHITK